MNCRYPSTLSGFMGPTLSYDTLADGPLVILAVIRYACRGESVGGDGLDVVTGGG
jgi:hypothetical protein